MKYKYQLEKEMSIIDIDCLNCILSLSYNGEIYKRRYNTSNSTISKNFGYIIFRFKNIYYKIKR